VIEHATRDLGSDCRSIDQNLGIGIGISSLLDPEQLKEFMADYQASQPKPIPKAKPLSHFERSMLACEREIAKGFAIH
jgi:hypothetical protein